MSGTHQMAAILTRRPRLFSAFYFGLGACILAVVWWSPVIFSGGILEWTCFIGSPVLAATLAGSVLGAPLVNVPTGIIRAAARGALIGSAALVLFAPLFSITYAVTHATEHWDVFGLTAIILMGSAVVIWWSVAVVAAALASVLYWVAHHSLSPP